MSNSKDSRIDVCFSETGLREGTVVAELDAKGDIMLTTSVRTAESTIEDETSLDTSFMDIQEIESIREQDAFMYHSIVQQQRRSNTVSRQGNCGGSRGGLIGASEVALFSKYIFIQHSIVVTSKNCTLV